MSNNYLSKRGFVIRKENYSSDELTKLKLELTARPLTDDKFKTPDSVYPIYVETKNKLYIPKMFGINKYGFPDTVLDNFEGKDWDKNHDFNGSLLERQLEPVNALLDACKEGGGILSACTGCGKTVMGLYVLSKLKAKTIIIVNKVPLMNQWKSEINKFLPSIKVGILQGQKNIDIEGADIVIAMLQSLARIDYPDELFKDFKCILVDEIHNTASRVFSKILFKLCCKYTIGLSATPKRSDGCEYVFKWHIGNIIYEINETRKGKPPIIKLLKIDTEEYKEVSTINKFTGQKQIQFTSMLSELVQMQQRNVLIIELIKDFIKNDSGRKILVLSDRRSHILNLKNLLDKDTDIKFTYGLFLGGMKEKELDKGRAAKIVLATFAAFSEGVSERDLDTLILVTPKKYIGHLENKMIKNESGKLNQIVGRVFRKDHIERNPIIVDLQDNFSVYKTQAKSRVIFYKDHFKNGIIEDLYINLDDNKHISVSMIKTKNKKTKNIQKENEENEGNLITKFCLLED
jgi:superfamily II DNA or RNA helicase